MVAVSCTSPGAKVDVWKIAWAWACPVENKTEISAIEHANGFGGYSGDTTFEVTFVADRTISVDVDGDGIAPHMSEEVCRNVRSF
jgi:hypothetical protein